MHYLLSRGLIYGVWRLRGLQGESQGWNLSLYLPMHPGIFLFLLEGLGDHSWRGMKMHGLTRIELMLTGFEHKGNLIVFEADVNTDKKIGEGYL